MEYPSNRLGLVLTVSLIALVTLTSSFVGSKAVGHAWPNFSSISSENVCVDGTCLCVSAFKRRKLYIPQDRLKSKQVEKLVQSAARGTDDVDRRIHLFYNQTALSLPTCKRCELSQIVNLVLEQYGDPEQIAIYKRQEIGETVTLLEEDEKAPFLEGLSLR